MKSLRLGLAGVVVVALSACSMAAPKYTASIPNVQVLKSSGDNQIAVNDFTASGSAQASQSLSIRGSSMDSPYDGSYAKYLSEALKQELSLAGRLAPTSATMVDGVLLANDENAMGFSVGTGDIKARFIVKKNGTVCYDQIKSAHIEWESSFAGAVAIPRAQEKYPELVQKLLANLLDDSSFLSALK